MRKTFSVTKIFVIGIIASSFLFSPFVLDFTLVPRFISFSLFLLLSIATLYRVNQRLTIRIDIVLLFFSGYVLFSALSFFWSINKSESVFEISKTIISLLAFLFTFYSLTKNKQYFMKALLKFSVVLVFIGMVFAVYQFTGIKNFSKEQLYSITGLNGHKNLYSSFLFLNLFFLIKGLYTLPRSWRAASIISILCTLILIVLLRTKAVWIGLMLAALICVMLYFYRSAKQRFKFNFYLGLAAWIIIANIFFLFFVPKIVSKGIDYNNTVNSSVKNKTEKVELDNERLILWQKSYKIFETHPLKGIGAGNWQINFPDQTLSGLWRAEDLNFTFQRPHNDFLWILSETGIIGFNLFSIFVFSIVLLLFKTLKIAANDRSESNDVILCFAFIVGYFTISFFDFPKERIEHIIWINVILGWSYYSIKRHNALKPFLNFSVARPAYALLTALTGFLTIIGILRYKGEFYTRKMYDYKYSGQNLKLIAAGNQALSFAYTLDPTSVPINWFTGNARNTLGNYPDAHKDFIAAYKFNPYNRNVVSDLASSYAQTGNSDSAKKYFLEAARISPRFDDAKLNLAAIYINEKNYSKAGECLASLFHDSERRSNYQKIVDAFKTENSK